MHSTQFENEVSQSTRQTALQPTSDIIRRGLVLSLLCPVPGYGPSPQKYQRIRKLLLQADTNRPENLLRSDGNIARGSSLHGLFPWTRLAMTFTLVFMRSWRSNNQERLAILNLVAPNDLTRNIPCDARSFSPFAPCLLKFLFAKIKASYEEVYAKTTYYI